MPEGGGQRVLSLSFFTSFFLALSLLLSLAFSLPDWNVVNVIIVQDRK